MTSPLHLFERPEMSHVSALIEASVSAPDVRALLDICIGRLASRDGDRFKIDDEQLRHIADWLRAALTNDEPWLKNVDDRGRPKKLMKFGSVYAIVREADKAMLKAAQKLRVVKLADGDEELVETLQDGYYVVRLLTPTALDRESAEMQHCIGNGGYDEYLECDKHEFLSLRDKAGRPHVTMEIENGCVTQLQGKQNAVPVKKYRDLLIPFIKVQKLQVDIPAYRLGYVIDIHGDWHRIDELPEGLEVEGSVNLARTYVSSIPRGLKVGSYLSLAHSAIKKLPEGLEIGGELNLNYTDIEALPRDLKVGGDLSLIGSEIRSLPENLIVGKGLYLSDTKIGTLPRSLIVHGDVVLDGSDIVSLPEGLRFAGNLDLQRTAISALPKGLVVEGHLDLRETPIRSLPEDLMVGGSIDLDGSDIVQLPNGFCSNGTLDLRRSKIKRLPKGLKVGGNLHIERTAITSLPDDIEVFGSIDLDGNSFEKLPDSIHDDKPIDDGSKTWFARDFRHELSHRLVAR